MTKPSKDPEFYKMLLRLADKVGRLRSHKQESMEKVALSIGVTRGTLFKIEHPQVDTDVSLATIWKLARYFGVPLPKLMEGLDPEPTASDFSSSAQSSGGGLEALQPTDLEPWDFLAFQLLPEAKSLQVRAELAEEACLMAQDIQQMESLSKHSSRLRQKRYRLLLKQRESQKTSPLKEGSDVHE